MFQMMSSLGRELARAIDSLQRPILPLQGVLMSCVCNRLWVGVFQIQSSRKAGNVRLGGFEENGVETESVAELQPQFQFRSGRMSIDMSESTSPWYASCDQTLQ